MLTMLSNQIVENVEVVIVHFQKENSRQK